MVHTASTRLAAASLAVCLGATLGLVPRAAFATDDFADASSSTVPYTETPVTSHRLCASLAGRHLNPSARITSAALIEKNSATGTPEFCDVEGAIGQSILFDVALPVQWNQRLYALGNGGCGEPLAVSFPPRDIGLANGFAVASTDTGHEGDVFTCQWAAYQPRLVVDFAYEGIHDTALVAKELVRIFYAQPALFSYYNSCSDGGHDGLEEVQRYPHDYDGVVAGSALLGAGTVMSNAWTTGAYEKLPSNQQFTTTQANYVASVVYAKCDALDGLKDGIINDPRSCKGNFNPDRDLKRCPGNTSGSTCLTAAQLAAYKKALHPVMSRSQAIYPGTPLGAEVEYAGNEIPSAPGLLYQSTEDYILSDQYMQYLFPWPRTQPNEFSDWTFDFDRDPSRILPFRRMFDPTNLDMRSFFSAGGKLLSYHGWADPLITPYGTVAFYEDEIKLYGLDQLATSHRLFMVPGMAHCFGGPGADQFDPMTKIIEWREAGQPPAMIYSRHFTSETQGSPSGPVTFTRTLCVYPEVAQYAGGPPKEAGSFTCLPGPRGVPDTGADFGLPFP